MHHAKRTIFSLLAAVALSVGLSLMTTTQGFADSTSSAAAQEARGPLQWKHGVKVTKAHVFDGAGSNIECVYPQGGVSVCIRFDRKTIYVRNDRVDGRFKLGQIKKQVGGATYRCQNDITRKAGDGTWVGCNFRWIEVGCYTMKSGYGQADWFVLNTIGTDKCYER